MSSAEHAAAPAAEIDPRQARHWLLRLLPIVAGYRALCLATVTVTVAYALFHSIVPALLGKTVDALASAAKAGDSSKLRLFIALLIAAGVARSITGYLSRLTLYRLSYCIEGDLRSLIYHHLTRLPFSFHDQARVGQLVSRANADVRAVQQFLVFAPYVAMISASFLLALSYMLSVNVFLALLALFPLPAIFLLSLRFRSVMFPMSWLVQSRLAEVATIVDENINGQLVIKLFAQEESQTGLLRRAAAHLRWAVVTLIEARSRYTVWIENLPAFGQLAVLLYGGWLVIHGGLGLGDLIAFNLYILLMQVPFQMLGFLIVLGQNAAASAQRIFDILDQPAGAGEAPTASDLAAPSGAVRFEEVAFSYGGERTVRNGRPLLDGLSFDIAAGETVGVVGRIGSGKSSIARLLLRFYDTEGGRITLDGHEIDQITRSSLRDHVVLVPDESFLFSASVRDNITYGRPGAREEDIMNAARAAQAHELIEALPKGYDTVLGEKGATLSGGQRQRIGLARALLLDPTVLILDEATSSIDVSTEEQIHRALRELRRAKTTILIGHRLSTITMADRILFLHDGTIVATGSHQDLMETEPRYRQVLMQPEPEASETPARAESDEEHYRRIRAGIQMPSVIAWKESFDV